MISKKLAILACIVFLLVPLCLLYFVFGKSLDFNNTKVDIKFSKNPERLIQDVHALFSTPQPRSISNKESLNIAANYIENEWKKLGLVVEKQGYKAGTYETYNLITRLGPTTGPRWVVGAHYDVCDEEAANNRGADDNASGVAVLLELSRLLVENKSKLNYTLELVAYSTEEPPFFATWMMGSYVHAKSLHSQRAEVKGMLSLEMLGYYSEEENSQSFPISALRYIYPTRGDFLMLAGDLNAFSLGKDLKNSFNKSGDFSSYTLNAPDIIRGIQFSDHRNYSAFDYKAIMLTDTAFYRNKNYHQSTDTPDTLNYEMMARIARNLAHYFSEAK